MAGSINWRASGTVYPSRFVSADTSQPGYYACQSATGTASILGVSQEGTYGAPGTAFDSSGQCASVSGVFYIYEHEDFDEPLLLLGAAVTAGQLLTSDASGRGIPISAQASGAAGTNYAVGAMARETNAVSGTLCRVAIKHGWVFNSGTFLG